MWPVVPGFRSLKVAEGRLITEEDEREGRRVVVLGRRPTGNCFREACHWRDLSSRVFPTP